MLIYFALRPRAYFRARFPIPSGMDIYAIGLKKNSQIDVGDPFSPMVTSIKSMEGLPARAEIDARSCRATRRRFEYYPVSFSHSLRKRQTPEVEREHLYRPLSVSRRDGGALHPYTRIRDRYFTFGGYLMDSTIPADLLELNARLEAWRATGKAESTVAKYRIKTPKPSSQTWKTFLSNHTGDIIGIVFFTVPTATFRNLYCFIILLRERRQVVHFNVTEHPISAWTAQRMSASRE